MLEILPNRKAEIVVSLVGRGAYDQEGTQREFCVLTIFYFLTWVVVTWLLKSLFALQL